LKAQFAENFNRRRNKNHSQTAAIESLEFNSLQMTAKLKAEQAKWFAQNE
jgi:hypothetical protein